MAVERCLGVAGASDQLGQRRGEPLDEGFVDFDRLVHRYYFPGNRKALSKVSGSSTMYAMARASKAKEGPSLR